MTQHQVANKLPIVDSLEDEEDEELILHSTSLFRPLSPLSVCLSFRRCHLLGMDSIVSCGLEPTLATHLANAYFQLILLSVSTATLN